MTRVGVRSEALAAAGARLAGSAEVLREEAASLAADLARCGSPAVHLLGAWVALEARGLHAVGPAGLWGQALALDVLAARLRAAARAYVEVERAVDALLAGVGRGAGTAARGGLLTDGGATVVLAPVPARWAPRPLTGPADLVALGDGLDGGRVRVVELDDGAGGSAWVVVVPGTQEWSPRAGPNPFDLTSDVRVVTGEATLAAAGVAGALAHARAAAGRSAPDAPRDPVLLVGHSQGGILAAALAADPAFVRAQRVTHVVTTGAPVGLVPVPESVRVLSVEHADDPVPALELTPNPSRPSWLTLRVEAGPATQLGRHRLGGYERTVRAAEDAPRGTVPGLGAWETSAGAFLHRPVRSVTEVVVARADGPVEGPAAPTGGSDRSFVQS